MNEQDIQHIAKQSARKLNLPSRRVRICKEFFYKVYSRLEFYLYWEPLFWYCRMMYHIVPKKYKHKYKY